MSSRIPRYIQLRAIDTHRCPKIEVPTPTTREFSCVTAIGILPGCSLSSLGYSLSCLGCTPILSTGVLLSYLGYPPVLSGGYPHPILSRSKGNPQEQKQDEGEPLSSRGQTPVKTLPSRIILNARDNLSSFNVCDVLGARCEENINDCQPNPCYTQGGGVCEDQVNGFRCICTNSIWTGPLCNRQQLCFPPGELVSTLLNILSNCVTAQSHMR